MLVAKDDSRVINRLVKVGHAPAGIQILTYAKIFIEIGTYDIQLNLIAAIMLIIMLTMRIL